MNHHNICLAWVAHNLGHATVKTSTGRRTNARTITSRVKPEARGARIRYAGAEIYSHHWWVMARFVTTPRGALAVLYRDVSYSPSTGRHQRDVRAVLHDLAPHVPVFPVPGEREGARFAPEHGDIVRGWADASAASFATALRARTQLAFHLARAQRCLDHIASYAALFDVPVPPGTNSFTNDPEAIVVLETKLAVLAISDSLNVVPFWR